MGVLCHNQKTNKPEYTNELTLLAFKIIAILHNTLLATFIKLLDTVTKGLFRNRSQDRCHTFLDSRHVCKTCAFHYALQQGKQKEVHRTPLIWRLRADFFLFPRLKSIMKGSRFLSSALFPCVCSLNADVSEQCLFHLHTNSPMKSNRTSNYANYTGSLDENHGYR
jgi:hypothetical protein